MATARYPLYGEASHKAERNDHNFLGVHIDKTMDESKMSN